ncbi:hypothetical protein DPEC_G00037650 [Dallia pectoralis]|uniref:Uncharacterized protein n=1 Tax=Dallia pectoralis TaxID=75939 RepID=A0ACC2HEL7_DALPE|nr:hypothetical protein DPEC_G00037650 [Dallia pectoralis]
MAMGPTAITIEEVRALEGKEEQEESILALLGIIGTFLNLFVIVFVYIYTGRAVEEAENTLNTGKQLEELNPITSMGGHIT